MLYSQPSPSPILRILLLCAVALPALGLPAGAAPGRPERDLRYLEIGYRQFREFERENPRLDPERLGAGAVEAAALAVAGRGTADSAVRYVTAGLDQCTGQWGRVECERMLLAFQRVVLQFSAVLPAPLLERLRTEAAKTVPPRDDEAARGPWDFHETENQRMVRMARCLAAYAVDPGGRAAEEATWAAVTAAFLRTHDRTGWYEAESPGYIATSANALLHLADHAPQPAIRLLARRELDLLFADWAQRQVDGFPAGAKSRDYVHWALGARNTPWVGWAWLIGAIGDTQDLWLMDWPEMAVSRYIVPEAVRELLAARRRQPPYEILARRSIKQAGRRPLDTALYTYATPDYVLGAAQAVDGLSLGLSGGQEIMATLYAASPGVPGFAPLYLWSRTQNERSERWTSWAGRDFAVGARNLLVTRLAAGRGTGYAYLSPPWEKPEPVSRDVLVTRCGDTWVALVTAGGWDVEPAPRRFPDYYGGDAAFRDAWVAVPRVQPAAVALEAGCRSEIGSFVLWTRRAGAARLSVEGKEIRFDAAGGTRITFVPGERAAVDGRPLDARSYPLLSGPFFRSTGEGTWTFSFGRREIQFLPLE